MHYQCIAIGTTQAVIIADDLFHYPKHICDEMVRTNSVSCQINNGNRNPTINLTISFVIGKVRMVGALQHQRKRH